MSSSDLVAYFSVLASLVCFLLYVGQTISAMRVTPHEALEKIAPGAAARADLAPPTIDELTKLIEATSRLTENLTRAGPPLVSLFGSIGFAAIAAIGSGAFH